MCNTVLVRQGWVGENITAFNEGWRISTQSLFFFLLSGNLKNANSKSAIAQHAERYTEAMLSVSQRTKA